ncbi:glycosyltransferase family 2 protein [Edaphobacter aggregans]|uniref:glycosyltransferase family 2 protein n=1 Tax=Edaphobacter aggregans TaxID=570835 RepID=UPI0005537CC1|nr:glycosyltransferase family 2 protein [Edaphobacter aggregans]
MQESISNSIQPEVKLLAVIVVFKIRPDASSSLLTLLAAARQAANSKLKLAVIIQDNTPGGQETGDLPEDVRYQAAPHNPGLAQAYNSALQIAEVEGYDWLLTLDQDTSVPINFLERISEIAAEQAAHPEVGAIVPKVVGDGRTLSPFRLAGGALPRWYANNFVGTASGPTYAVNSASTVRVAALRQIGGYDPFFPLDISDLNMFHKLANSGKKVFIAGDVIVHHELALLRKEERMSVERYRAGLLDECAFWDMKLGSLARLERIVRLTGRAFKDLLDPQKSQYLSVTLSEMKRRLFTSRRRRIDGWREWSNDRAGLSERRS